MRPHTIMHMGSSIDGRIVPTHWPTEALTEMGDIYERLHRELDGDAWIVGRVTMAEFGKGEPIPVTTTETFPRISWKAPGAEHGPYAIALDQGGKLHLNISKANGDPIVAVLIKAVPDSHLAELRRDGISHIFAGTTALDLPLALETLAADFGIKRLLLEGGGGINGSFLAEHLIDEISLMIAPIADGSSGMPTTFERPPGPSQLLTLTPVDRLAGGLLHLRYEVHGPVLPVSEGDRR